MACAWTAASALAQGPAVPFPDWVRSVEVADDGAVAYGEPRTGAQRRGTVSEGTHLPARRRVSGTGCSTGFWVEVGEEAYICERFLRPTREPVFGLSLPVVPEGHILPNTYAFVAFDGTRAFAHPSDSEADQYVEALGEGFGLIVTGSTTYGGMRFLRTRGGLWVERSNVRFASGSDFEGTALVDGRLAVAWVRPDRIDLHDRPHGRVLRRVSRRTRLSVAERVNPRWVRLEDGSHARVRDLSWPKLSTRPESVAPAERWLDVDVGQQVMVAYEGDRPVYATLVSTGRGGVNRATPLGEYRIWVKLATSNMDDLERDDVERNYSIEGVPWVQYFEGANGFHAAFWHDDFGTRRSHGCVNLSPRDARWLFDFTGPRLPAGWYAVLPNSREQGTLVRIRDGAP